MIATATRLVEGVLRPDDGVGRAIVEAVLVQLPLAAISLYIAARAQWSLARGLTTARAGV